MSEETIANIVSANRDAPIVLAVMDRRWGEYHQFTLTPVGALRLATECLDAVNARVTLGNEAFRALSAK